MKTTSPLLFATLLLAVALAGCGDRQAPAASGQDPQASSDEPSSFIGRAAKKGLDEARKKLASENLDLNGEINVHVNGRQVVNQSSSDLPKAELTPQGDLLIEGSKVQVDAQQHALLKQYRGQLERVAMTGMDIGEQGADIAGKALGEAVAGIFSGNTDQIEQKVQAQADKIKVSAMKLCEQLPAMMQTQQALAASLPEFKPYATMEQADIDDCFNDEDLKNVPAETRAKVQQEIRDNIRGGIRGGIQGVAQAVGIASSGTGDTVQVNGVRFLLPPGGVSTETTNGNAEISVSNGLRVRYRNGDLWVNGEQYPAPKAGGEVDLGTDGTVKVDGKVVSAI